MVTQLIKCDQCGKSTEIDDGDGWWILREEAIRMRVSESRSRNFVFLRLDFCQAECLLTWIHNAIIEKE